MPIAHIDKKKHLYYEQHGSGLDLVLIGGFTSDHTIWNGMPHPLEFLNNMD